MTKTKLAVVGCTSMVGSRFCGLAKNWAHLTQADFKGDINIDITDIKSVENLFQNHDFEWVALFSAFTDVDEAEKQRDDKRGSCWQINVEGVKNIINACQAHQKKLIFISTDFVFDGTSGPYSEDDPTGPDLTKVSWYGITKIEAEKLITTGLSDFLILRIAYPYRSKFPGKDDLAKRTLRLYFAGQLYPMFTDQFISPTFIDDIAPTIHLLITTNQKGIFHLVSPTVTTQYEFAKELISVFGGNPAKVQKGSLVEFLKEKSQIPRPLNSALKADKIKALGFGPTDWKKGIKIIYTQSGGKLI